MAGHALFSRRNGRFSYSRFGKDMGEEGKTRGREADGEKG